MITFYLKAKTVIEFAIENDFKDASEIIKFQF